MAAKRIVIDPVTRIEGHLRVEVEVNDGKVTDAFSSGTMVRGLEIILRGRRIGIGAELQRRVAEAARGLKLTGREALPVFAREDLADAVSRFLLQSTMKRPIVIPVIVSI